MFILANRNIILPDKSGVSSFMVKSGALCEVPDQFCDTPYFYALVKDGKIAVPAGKKDSQVIKASEDSGETLKETVKRTRKSKD